MSMSAFADDEQRQPNSHQISGGPSASSKGHVVEDKVEKSFQSTSMYAFADDEQRQLNSHQISGGPSTSIREHVVEDKVVENSFQRTSMSAFTESQTACETVSKVLMSLN
jgi:hypothetical protein